MSKLDARSALIGYILGHGPIRAARVSSAQARGRAGKYPYWGVANYEIRLRKSDGQPTVVSTSRAGSDRRSFRLAEKDLLEHCDKHKRIPVGKIGVLSDEECQRVLACVGTKNFLRVA